MNFFEFYSLPESFYPNKEEVKRKYIENSRAFHPDHHTMANVEQQEVALENSIMNNQAYACLKDFDRTMAYILECNQMLESGDSHNLSSDFLMQMMDINEALLDKEMGEEVDLKEISTQVYLTQKEMLSEIDPDLKKYSADNPEKQQILNKVKEYYLKNRYLLRIIEKVNTFANH